MPNNLKRLLVLGGVVLCMSPAFAGNGTTTFIGPTLQGAYSGWLNPTSAYSAIGEVGAGNYRINLTAGTIIDDTQRLKFTAEYLWQRINYSFATDNAKLWVQQVAVGADYQYAIGCDYKHYLDLSVYAAHSPNRNLGSRDIIVTTDDGLTHVFANNRRVAGANAWGFAPGIAFMLWEGSLAGIDLNYDDVRYTKTYAPMRAANGVGGTVYFQQSFYENLSLRLEAARRKPFRNYKANLSWNNLTYKGRWSVGLFGDYLSGRVDLPNTWNAGLSVNYFADCTLPPPPIDLKNEFAAAGAGGSCPEVCLDSSHPYAVVYSPNSPPRLLNSLPPEIGPKLRITRARIMHDSNHQNNGRTRS